MNDPRSKSARSRNPSAGFTLVEVLVVITIIVVLAALTTAMIGRVLVSSRRAVCVDILRQYGTATFGYLSDNQNRMPNLQGNWQRPNYTSQGGNQIFGHLLPYLGLEKKSKLTALPDTLVCPAWRKRFPNWNPGGGGNNAGSVYWVNQDQSMGGARVFGTQGGDRNDPGYQLGMDYSKVMDGTATARASKIPFMTDGQGFVDPREQGNPVHGEYRNCLYFDFHVESRPFREVRLAPVTN